MELTVRKKVDNEIKTYPIVRDEVVLQESYAKSTIISKGEEIGQLLFQNFMLILKIITK